MQGILGPSGVQGWLDGKIRFVKMWARGIVCAPAAWAGGGTLATGTAPLVLFSRKQDDDTIPAIPAGSNVVANEEIDLALTQENTAPELPWDATHCGIYIEPRCVGNNVAANDVAAGLADIEMICARTWVELFFGDPKNPWDRGIIPEFPAGYGLEVDATTTAGATTLDQYRNGPAVPSVIHPLPIPKHFQEDTTIRVRFTPTHGGYQTVVAHGLRCTVYGVKLY